MRRIWISTPLVLVFVLAATAACGSSPSTPSADPSASGIIGAADTPTATATTPGGGGGPGTTPATTAALDWPSPSDCISYNPAAITVHYEAGIWAVSEGLNEIVRAYGFPTENVGQKLLAVAKRYRQVCFIGRGNYRENKDEFIFEYWRNPSGISTTVPDSEDDCSPYNRNNLTVENMGGGDGWRVKDHDHVLQLFDHEADARNGKIVLAKYNQICVVPSDHGDVPANITYS